eukprot:m.225282 g.225282  ORF g.225282 m.225282 type:complete len:131 (+) comp40012_c0_seq27:386-778(+)
MESQIRAKSGVHSGTTLARCYRKNLEFRFIQMTAFHPSTTDIQNHIYKAKAALQLSKLDQENLRHKITIWESCNPDSLFYYQPYIQHEAEAESQPFMYVHQEKWQRDLLARYGNTISLMDATSVGLNQHG